MHDDTRLAERIHYEGVLCFKRLASEVHVEKRMKQQPFAVEVRPMLAVRLRRNEVLSAVSSSPNRIRNARVGKPSLLKTATSRAVRKTRKDFVSRETKSQSTDGHDDA
jgi:hypothetical protein